jgi:hypothetical protein
MIVSDIIDLHRTVQNLLRQQAALFQEKNVDFERAESLSQEVSGLLVSLPTAEALSTLEGQVREQLLETARGTATALAVSAAALSRYRQLQIEAGAHEERGDMAMRAYLPVTEHQPAHFLDERR